MIEAIAFAGGDIYIDVPGRAAVAELEQQLLEAFSQIASIGPPPKLVDELSATP